MKLEHLDNLHSNEFFMPFNDYLDYFKGTSINHDCAQRAHYRITNIGTDMKNKQDMFLSFYLHKEIDCTKEEFGIVCE